MFAQLYYGCYPFTVCFVDYLPYLLYSNKITLQLELLLNKYG